MEGTGRFWRLHWPKLRVKDYRLFLRAIQINDRVKGFNPLTDSPPSPELSFLDPLFSRAVQWGQTLRISVLGFPKLSASSSSTLPGRGWNFRWCKRPRWGDYRA